MQYITKEEFAELSHENLNEAIERAVNRAVEQTLLALPDFILNLLRTSATFEEMRKKFLNDNGDVVEDKGLFGSVLDKTENEHPDWTYEQILSETAREVRRTKGVVDSGKVCGTGKPCIGDVDQSFNGVI